MVVELVRDFRFEAAHRLPRVPAGHKCTRLHGHSFKVQIAVKGPVDPQPGWFVDYQTLSAAWTPLHDQLDHYYLNEIDGLDNPTSENLAQWIWQRLKKTLPSLCRVTIFETCTVRCDYFGE